MLQVTVLSPGRCEACGGRTVAQGRASAPAAAVRHARDCWPPHRTPTTFTIERWSRGEPPRLVCAGAFPGWDELREIAGGVR